MAPASPPDATSDMKRSRLVATPGEPCGVGIEAGGAHKRRPVAVCSSRYQMATATTAQ